VALTFGNVPKPKIDMMICAKAGDGDGFNFVDPRSVIGVCDHITDGNGTNQFYHDFFSIGGQRAKDALVDFVIDKSGNIAMLNDPFGNRMPWASGGSDGLEGDGPAFVNARGIFGINGELASKEHIGVNPSPMTDAQNEASAKLTAWLFDGASNHPRGSKVPWDQYPFNPNVGCVTAMQHFEFATKPCPGDGIRGQTTEHQAFVRGLLKAGQTAVPPKPDPTPGPPTPAKITYPAGMDKAKAEADFGTGELYRPKKTMAHFGYHETSAVSLAWLKRGGEKKVYPKALSWHQLTTATTDLVEVVAFADGSILWRPTSRAAWSWM
jgi:hypothetical protein